MEHIPSAQEVMGIWADTYRLYLEFQGMEGVADVLFLEDAINRRSAEIVKRYHGCRAAREMTDAAVRLLVEQLRESGKC